MRLTCKWLAMTPETGIVPGLSGQCPDPSPTAGS